MLGFSDLDEEVGVNQALRSAMMAAGLQQLDLASRLEVDPKTVDRWLAGRLPHPSNRTAIAKLLGREEGELWPHGDADRRMRHRDEVRSVYPHRWAVPREVWVRHFGRAESEISILVYSGLFLAEDAGIVKLLGDKASSGVLIRMLVGDAESAEVGQRGADEGIGDSVASRIRNALALFRPLAELENVHLRLHGAVLYNSLFRSDDELLVNPHIFGISGSNAPLLHVRRTDDGSMVSTYLESFERVWSSARDL